MFKTKIKKWLKRIITVSLLSVILSLGLTVSTTYAVVECASVGTGSTCTKAEADACPSGFTAAADKTTCNKSATSQKATDQEIAQANFLAGLQKALNRLIWPILVLIGGLMDNGLLFGMGMEQKLQDIWIPIRNLVNILFVIVLVGIALYNVLGIGDESGNYSIKSALPKIIIALIAVNFSFLAIKVFLDAINVLTSSVFNLPGQVSEGLTKIDTGDQKGLCASLKNITTQELGDKSEEAWATETLNDKARLIAPEFLTGTNHKSIAKMDYNEIEEEIRTANGANGDTKAEAYQAKFDRAVSGRICTGSTLSPAGTAFLTRWNSKNAAFAMALSMGKIVHFQDVDPDSLKNVRNLAINTLFSFFMYLLFTISFLALFVVLLARLVVMWLSIALSPVLILILAAPTLKEKMGGFNKIAENFVKLAIAPLIIALSMTIGWIMLNALRGLNGFSKDSALSMDPSNGIPVVGLSSIQDLTVAVGTIAIIWLGVFGAAEGTIAEKATGFMKEQFQRFGTYVGTMPFKHIPFMPVTLPSGKIYKATGAEAAYALKQSFQKEPTGLWEEITGKKPVTADTVNDKDRVKDDKGIAQWIYSSKNNLKDDEYIRELQYIRDHGKTRSEVPADPLQVTAIDEYLKSEKTDKDLQTLLNTPKIQQGQGGLTPATSEKAKTGAPAAAGTKPATPPPPPAPTLEYNGQITQPGKDPVVAKIGGQDFQAIYGTTTLGPQESAQVTQFRTRLGALAAVTKDTKQADVLAAARDAHLNRTGKPAIAPTPDELKALLGEAKYKEVEKAAGGAAALGKALKDGATAAAATPAAPAAAGPPAATSPPGPDLPAGGTDPLGDADAGTGPPPGP